MRRQPLTASDDASDQHGPSITGRDSDSQSSGTELDEAEQALEQQLADIPFEVLEKLNQDGKGPTAAAARAAAIAAKQQTFHRENKNRPQEVSSKRPISRFREVIQVPKQGAKDPRFEPTVGGKPFDKQVFAKRYSFLYNDVLPEERAKLKQQLKKEKREDKRWEIQAQLTRLQQQLSEEQVRRRSQQLQHDWKVNCKPCWVLGSRCCHHLQTIAGTGPDIHRLRASMLFRQQHVCQCRCQCSRLQLAVLLGPCNSVLQFSTSSCCQSWCRTARNRAVTMQMQYC
eukprot:GHRR01022991.1.p1 GENE.GHRR01022991.1~~GHRR01022991.1.p1  ORF type:complete len:285 (+),score=98.94 GHRR01022991.1:173-1027(+)